jgi:hypothetical protein
MRSGARPRLAGLLCSRALWLSWRTLASHLLSTPSDDDDAGFAIDAGQQLDEIVASQRDAAFGRLQSTFGDMHKDRAAFCAHAWVAIVVDHHDHVVEAVLAPESFRARRIGMLYGAVVVAVIRCVAPSVVGSCLSQRESRLGTAKRVAPPEAPFEAKRAAWRRAVSLAFSRANSAASQCASDLKVAERQPANGALRPRASNDDVMDGDDVPPYSSCRRCDNRPAAAHYLMRLASAKRGASKPQYSKSGAVEHERSTQDPSCRR